MTRIGTLGANTAYIARIMDIQTRVQAEQVQVTSGMKSQTYDGIASGTNTLINFENEISGADTFIENNNVQDTKLQAASTAVTGVQKALKVFRDSLASFKQNNPKNELNIKNIQKSAFETMQALQADLATNVNGQYLFSGGRVSEVPVQLQAASLTEFQAMYDGYLRTAPTTRSADLQDMTLTNLETSALSFDGAGGIIKPVQADAFKGIYAGSSITVSDSAASPPNNGTYTVKSKAICDVTGTPLAEGSSTANVISYGDPPVNILTTDSTQLNFTFAPDGTMKMTADTAGSLAGLTVGTKFTIGPELYNGGATTGYEGAYEVISNLNGVVNFKTNFGPAKAESVASTAISFGTNGSALAHPTTAGTLNFTTTTSNTTGLTTVTLSAATGATVDFAGVSVGDQLSIGGTQFHNGTFTVTDATATTLSFVINPEGARVSQFLPQTGRADPKISFYDSNTAAQATLDSAKFTSLSFSPTGTKGERITAAKAGAFLDEGGNQKPATGSIITLSSTTGVNDGVYKVVSNGGDYLEIESVSLTTESKSTAAKISSDTWYKGDTLQLQHRVDNDRTVDVAAYASDPAFEKAMRALALIAQGVYGTPGGLENHQERIAQAQYLIADALESPAPGTPPFGTEQAGDLRTVVSRIDGTRKTISLKNEKHEQFKGFLGQRVIDISQIDKTEAATKMLADQTALEASYQTLAKVSNLNLLQYLK